jgi:ribosomal protein S18 acetylase RimI-like enzyme
MDESSSTLLAPRRHHAPRIRPARAGDAAAWRALQAGIYAEGAWFVGDGPPSEGALAARLRALDARRGCVFLALVGDDLAGWCEASRLAATRLEHVAVLTLAVAAPFRRRGCGGALLAAAEGWARDAGVHKLSLAVRARNEAARALYRRAGFGEEGLERAQIRLEEGFEDNVLMAKHLEGP